MNFVLIGYVPYYGRKQTSLHLSVYGCMCDKFNHHPVCALNLRQKDWPLYHIYYIYYIKWTPHLGDTSLKGRLPPCILSITHCIRHITRILGDTRLKASLLHLFIWLVVLCTSYHMNPFFLHLGDTSLKGRLPPCILSITHCIRHITRILGNTNPWRHSSEGKPPPSVYLIGCVVHVISHESFFLASQGVIWSGYVPNCPLGQTPVFKADLVPPSRLLFGYSWNKCTSCSYPTWNKTEMKNHENWSKLN